MPFLFYQILYLRLRVNIILDIQIYCRFLGIGSPDRVRNYEDMLLKCCGISCRMILEQQQILVNLVLFPIGMAKTAAALPVMSNLKSLKFNLERIFTACEAAYKRFMWPSMLYCLVIIIITCSCRHDFTLFKLSFHTNILHVYVFVCFFYALFIYLSFIFIFFICMFCFICAFFKFVLF